MANCYSCGDWRLEQPITVRLPSVIVEVGRFGLSRARLFLRRVARQPLVRTRPVVITPVSRQLLFQVMLVPEKTVVQILSTQSADEAFDKRMGNRRIRHRLNRIDLQYS